MDFFLSPLLITSVLRLDVTCYRWHLPTWRGFAGWNDKLRDFKLYFEWFWCFKLKLVFKETEPWFRESLMAMLGKLLWLTILSNSWCNTVQPSLNLAKLVQIFCEFVLSSSLSFPLVRAANRVPPPTPAETCCENTTFPTCWEMESHTWKTLCQKEQLQQQSGDSDLLESSRLSMSLDGVKLQFGDFTCSRIYHL